LTIHGTFLASLILVASLALAVPIWLLGLTDLDRLTDLLLPLTALTMLPAVTLATWAARRMLDRRTFSSLGVGIGPRTWSDLAIGVLVPAPLFGLAYLLFSALGWLEFQGWSWADGNLAGAVLGLVVMGVVFAAVGFYEELLFRGYYLQNLIDGTNLPAALALSSIAFGLAHLGNFGASWASTLGILLAGLFLSFAWIRTGSLWLSIGIHLGWNFFQGPIFGFAVSGTSAPALIEHTVNGPDLVTGGAFGPEAGLIVIPMLALGTGLILLYTRGRTSTAADQPN